MHLPSSLCRILPLPLAAAAILFLAPATGWAQRPVPERKPVPTAPGGVGVQCVTGCTFDYEVQVTATGGLEPARTSFTSGYTTTYNVKNTGLLADTFALTCTVSGGTCSASPSQAALSSGQQVTLTATYNTGEPQAGTVTGSASSLNNDPSPGSNNIGNAPKNVTITGPGKPILVQTATEVRYRDMGKCLANCLHMTYARSTASYFTMGQAQNATLVYNSSTHQPIVTVGVDVSAANAQTTAPTTYKIQVRKPDGTLATFLNSSTSVYFTSAGAPSSVTTRLTAALDAQANNLTTGAWPLNVVVTAQYAASSFTDSLTQIALVNDQSGSVFGAGVSLAGYQRIYITNGRAAITEGDGSIADYGPSPYSAPPGASSTLIYSSGVYTRTYRDGSRIQFDFYGRMIRLWDRFNSLARVYGYFGSGGPTDTLISTITDQMGKAIYPCYNHAVCGGSGNGKLYMLRLLSGAGVERIHNYLMDASNRLIRVKDPDNLSDSLGYDAASGLLNQVYNRARDTTAFVTYDALRRLATVQQPRITLHDGTTARPTVTTTAGELTLWQPALAGSSTTPKVGLKGDTVSMVIRDPLNVATRYTVDKFGGPTKIVDPFNAATTIFRDGSGRPLIVTEPNGHYTSFSYNSYYQLTGASDGPSGTIINYYYRNTTTDDLAYTGGNTVRTDYLYYNGSDGGPNGALKKVYVGNTSGAVYPAIDSGRVVEWHKPDALGRDTAVVDSLGHGTHWQYEASWGNLWKATDAAGLTTRLTYDVEGRPDSTITPLAARSKVTYGPMNETLTQVWSGNSGYKVTTTYDSLLQPVRVATPKGGGWSGSAPVVYKYAYNRIGALVARFDAADTTKADSTKYDAAGNVRVAKNRNNKSITMTYDKAGRLLTRLGPDFPTDNFAYDTVMGRWQVAYNSIARDSVHLDTRGRQDMWMTVLNGKFYYKTLTYDAIDRVTRRKIQGITPIDSTTVNFYYANSTGVRDSLCVYAPKQCVTFMRKADFVKDTLVFNRGTGNSWKLIQGSDAAHRTTLQDYSPAALAAFDVTQTFDTLSRARNRTSPKGGAFTRRVFSYDSLGQLVNACDSTGSQCQNVVNLNPSVNAWTYDSAGNRAEVGASYYYGAGNRLTASGWAIFGYDSTGSVVCRNAAGCPGSSAGYTYGWDALGRLREIRNGSTGVLIDSMYYDALGRRVGKKMVSSTEWYVYDGNQIIWDLDNAGTKLREYAWFPGETDKLLALKSGTTVAAALLDPVNGSVRGLANFATGAKIKEYAETPWGDTVADTGLVVRYRFAGREFDQESGLYYMRARYYDPTLGRWISEDPIGIAGGANLYAYAGNDPVNNTDPSGLSVVCYDEIHRTAWVDPTTGRVDHYDPEYRIEKCYDVPGGPGEDGPPTNANKGERTPDKPATNDAEAETDEPDPCGAAPLKAMGWSAFGATGIGPFAAGGAYATGRREGGKYTTSGTAYGLGGGFDFDVTFSTSRAAMDGRSRGVCVTLVIGVCVTGNFSGLNFNVGVGPGVGAAYVDTRTILTKATACKKP